MNEDEPTVLDFLSPDVILPNQFFDTRRSHCGDQGIHRLMVALIEGGLRDLMGGKLQYAMNAVSWFSGDHAAFSFETVCLALNTDPDFLRGRIRKGYGKGRKIPRRSPVNTESRSHPTPTYVRVRHDRRHDHHDGSKKRVIDLPFVPV